MCFDGSRQGKNSTRDRSGANLATMELEAYLKVADQFKLGDLVTEQPHPETAGLAGLAQRDLHTAIDTFHRVDRLALGRLGDRLGPLPELVESMRRTLRAGGRIFLAGCGATGRLALSIETIARERWLDNPGTDRVIAFMAGGDTALIRSLEAFEDYPEYGRRQLHELGFGPRDLLLAITEGGETPFVIGACEAAAELSGEAPWFLFCNPTERLRSTVARSRAVLESPRIHPFCLEVGPMALSGSTRLQAATVQMLVAGAALGEALGAEPAETLVREFARIINSLDFAFAAPFIEAEATALGGGGLILYQTDTYGITVLTDTTERSPTFSIPPFENRHRAGDALSPWYLSLPGCPGSKAAWRALLHRSPRTLEWPELKGQGSLETLLGHDISAAAPGWRKTRHPDRRQFPFLIHRPGPVLEFAGLSHSLGMEKAPLLLRHLVLKCFLNLHSTLVMGRMGRFESNLMTHVRPSNYKLVDRAARYLQEKSRQEKGRALPYREAVAAVFAGIRRQ